VRDVISGVGRQHYEKRFEQHESDSNVDVHVADEKFVEEI